VGLAGIWYARGKFRQAQHEYEEMLTPLTAALGPHHTNVASTLANLANVSDYLGEHERAVAYGERALASLESKETPAYAILEVNLAIYLRSLGQYARAHKLVDACLALRRHLLGPEHPLIGEAEYHQALLLIAEQKWNEARAHAQTALPLIERGFGSQHRRLADVLDALGVIDRQQGRPAAALERHRRALVIREQSRDAAERPTTLTDIGLAQLAMGQAGDARHSLEEALSLRDAAEGNPKTRAETAFALARAITMSEGFGARAQALATDAVATLEHGGAGYALSAAEARRWLNQQQGTKHKGEGE
jgi:tetratricopeptide (TPR) repeat protein